MLSGKVEFMKRKNIGIDRCTFELDFKTQVNNMNQVVSIVSPYNLEFGEIEMKRGRMMISLCLPKYFDVHNAIPLKMDKADFFDEITETVLNTIRDNYDSPFKTKLTSIEVNITEVFEHCDYEKVFLLFSHVQKHLPQIE